MYSLYEVEQILRNKQVFVCSLAFGHCSRLSPRLLFQRRFEHRRQVLAAAFRPPQNTLTGFWGQRVSRRRVRL